MDLLPAVADEIHLTAALARRGFGHLAAVGLRRQRLGLEERLRLLHLEGLRLCAGFGAPPGEEVGHVGRFAAAVRRLDIGLAGQRVVRVDALNHHLATLRLLPGWGHWDVPVFQVVAVGQFGARRGPSGGFGLRPRRGHLRHLHRLRPLRGEAPLIGPLARVLHVLVVGLAHAAAQPAQRDLPKQDQVSHHQDGQHHHRSEGALAHQTAVNRPAEERAEDARAAVLEAVGREQEVRVALQVERLADFVVVEHVPHRREEKRQQHRQKHPSGLYAPRLGGEGHQKADPYDEDGHQYEKRARDAPEDLRYPLRHRALRKRKVRE